MLFPGRHWTLKRDACISSSSVSERQREMERAKRKKHSTKFQTLWKKFSFLALSFERMGHDFFKSAVPIWGSHENKHMNISLCQRFRKVTKVCTRGRIILFSFLQLAMNLFCYCQSFKALIHQGKGRLSVNVGLLVSVRHPSLHSASCTVGPCQR